ncbi:hypothetical protein Tco_0304030 [Tanacetum coccineum]
MASQSHPKCQPLNRPWPFATPAADFPDLAPGAGVAKQALFERQLSSGTSVSCGKWIVSSGGVVRSISAMRASMDADIGALRSDSLLCPTETLSGQKGSCLRWSRCSADITVSNASVSPDEGTGSTKQV